MKKRDLLKYINNELTPDKRLEVSKWINRSDSNRQYFNCLRESFVLMTLPEDRAPESEYDLFKKRFSLKENNKTAGLFTKKSFIAAAAVILLFIAVGLSVFEKEHDNYTNIIANNTSEILLQNLPDGSIIGLSPNSEIRYTPHFNQKNREIILNGTCYFDVEKNKELPFRIHPFDNCAGNCETDENAKPHKDILIEVTGTRFYTTTTSADSNLLELALQEGSVNVKTYRNGTKESISLKEGDYLEITHSMGHLKSTIAEHGNSMDSAMKSYLHFKDTKLSDIVKRLAMVHHCKFNIADPKIADNLLTADLANNTLEDILQIFEVTMGVQSTVNENGVIELYRIKPM